MQLPETLLLVTALSVDALTAGFAYGADRIRIPLPSVMVISAVCALSLTLSLLAGAAIGPLLPADTTGAICFLILAVLGLAKLFDSSIKRLIRKRRDLSRRVDFSLFHLHVILHIYAEPQCADNDASKVLSVSEAASLALALSLDGLAVGFGAGLVSAPWVQVLLCSLAAGFLCVSGGDFFGRRIAEKLPFDLSWVSGAMLILLAVFKLV